MVLCALQQSVLHLKKGGWGTGWRLKCGNAVNGAYTFENAWPVLANITIRTTVYVPKPLERVKQTTHLWNHIIILFWHTEWTWVEQYHTHYCFKISGTFKVVPKVVYNTLPRTGKMANITYTIWWDNVCPIMPNAIKMFSLHIISQTTVASVWESQWHGLKLGKQGDREGVVTLPIPSAGEHPSTVSA
jgi:hypothetical protein